MHSITCRGCIRATRQPLPGGWSTAHRAAGMQRAAHNPGPHHRQHHTLPVAQPHKEQRHAVWINLKDMRSLFSCSDSRAIPNSPSQLKWKTGLPWANRRGSLNFPLSFPGEKARSWGALGEARPGQSSLSAGALRYRACPRHAGFPRGEHRGSRHRFL